MAVFSQASLIIRLQACDIISTLVFRVVETLPKVQTDSPMLLDWGIQDTVLKPLMRLVTANKELVDGETESPIVNSATDTDVQRIALSTLNRVLQSAGENFTPEGYDVIFDIIRNASPKLQRSSLMVIRVAFPALQLICTDFLHALNDNNLTKCITTVGRFASQVEDMNIALTSVGLLWSLCDFLRGKRKSGSPETASSASLDLLEKTILLQLSALSGDARPEVRNTSIQTLFRAISMTFGPMWSSNQWNLIVEEVIFESMRRLSQHSDEARRKTLSAHIVGFNETTSASWIHVDAIKAKIQTPAEPTGNVESMTKVGILKQWDEAKVLLLSGIANVVSDYLPVLLESEAFWRGESSMWSHILEFFFDDACGVSWSEDDSTPILRRQDSAVAAAAVKGLRQLLKKPSQVMEQPDGFMKIRHMWRNAWDIYQRAIGLLSKRKLATMRVYSALEDMPTKRKTPGMFLGMQVKEDALAALINIFRDIWDILDPSLQSPASHLEVSADPFIPRDLDELFSSTRDILTFYDCTICESADAPLDAILCEYFDETTLENPASYDRNPESDVNDLSRIQTTVLELLLGTTKVASLKEVLNIAQPSKARNDVEFVGVVDGFAAAYGNTELSANPVVLRGIGMLFSLAFIDSELGDCLKKNGWSTLRTSGEVSSSLQSIGAVAQSKKLSVLPPFSNYQTLIAVPKPSYIALGKFSLTLMAELFKRSDSSALVLNRDIYLGTGLSDAFQMLRVPVKLRYDCVFVDETVDHARCLWKQACETYATVLESSFNTIKDGSFPSSVSHQIWDCLVALIEALVDNQRYVYGSFGELIALTTMSSFPPPNIDPEVLKNDEIFETSLIRSLIDFAAKFVGDNRDANPSCTDETVVKLMTLLEKSSCSSKNEEMLIGVAAGSQSQSTIPAAIPVVRERLAQSCLELLFSFCEAPEEFATSQARKRIGLIAFDAICRRSKTVIRAWISDATLYSRFPFPRTRIQEMYLVLRKLYDLNLNQVIAAHIVANKSRDNSIGTNP